MAKQRLFAPKCSKCGRRFPVWMQRADGLPLMLGFVEKDNKTTNVCADCLMEIGKEKETGEII